MPNEAVNLDAKLAQLSEHWSPKIVSGFNESNVMVVKALGEFNWHHHDDTDDFLFVLEGTLLIEMRRGDDRKDVLPGPGELFIVPKWVEHRPVADEEVHYLPIELEGVPNTGDEGTAVQKVAIWTCPLGTWIGAQMQRGSLPYASTVTY